MQQAGTIRQLRVEVTRGRLRDTLGEVCYGDAMQAYGVHRGNFGGVLGAKTVKCRQGQRDVLYGIEAKHENSAAHGCDGAIDPRTIEGRIGDLEETRHTGLID